MAGRAFWCSGACSLTGFGCVIAASRRLRLGLDFGALSRRCVGRKRTDASQPSDPRNGSTSIPKSSPNRRRACLRWVVQAAVITGFPMTHCPVRLASHRHTGLPSARVAIGTSARLRHRRLPSASRDIDGILVARSRKGVSGYRRRPLRASPWARPSCCCGGVEEVASWPALRVEPRGRVEGRYAVDHRHCPLAVVDQCVVVAAEQDRVADRGDTAVGPVMDMVGVAVFRWSAAAG